jgi:hypothetical protein
VSPASNAADRKVGGVLLQAIEFRCAQLRRHRCDYRKPAE